MNLLNAFMSMLDLKGIKYIMAENSIQFLICSHSHKWQCAVTADNGFLNIFSRYPWRIPEDSHDRLLRKMNTLNCGLSAGCFLINSGSPVFRYSAYISDPLLFSGTAERHFRAAAAMTEKAWDDIFLTLNAAEA